MLDIGVSYMEYNIYCDESCHLPRDKSNTMVVGAIWSPALQSRAISLDIKTLKNQFNLPPSFEIKWSKVSKGKLDFYLALVDYFFSNKNLSFRALIVPNKSKLKHEKFNQDHDQFYYKMFFTMLRAILEPDHKYNLYLDIKDTLGAQRIEKLREVLSNDLRDFDRSIIQKTQHVHSHEVTQIQIADFFIGAISYLNRNMTGNDAKLEVLNKIRTLSGKTLSRSTLLRENKFNLFYWQADMGDR